MIDHSAFFADFRASIAEGDAFENLRGGLIGKNALIPGPKGPQKMLYADYVASGRAIVQIEDAIRDYVLPFYANSHTEASFVGAYITTLRHQARAEIAKLCNMTEKDHAVIFTGSGATAALNRIVHLLGVDEAVRSGRGATIIHGPYEHHSNILPWRESGAMVIEIPEAAHGGPDMAALDRALANAQGLIVGSFSAASNVSGILTDVLAVTRKLRAAGAKVVWDYAGGGPYLPIDMMPAADAAIDAIAVSPHKFVGGPASSGLLLIRRDAVTTMVPTFPGGGTVRYVSRKGHDYLADVTEREEAGTPNALADIRVALTMIAKDAATQARIDAANADFAARMIAAFAKMPRLRLLGRTDCARLPIFSFLIREGAQGPINPQLATRIMSDEFGIQMRGGCACAGPYGHTLLDIDDDTSEMLRQRILKGDLTEKPGFVRFNLSYLATETEVAKILSALEALPALCDAKLADYGYDAETGTFTAKAAE